MGSEDPTPHTCQGATVNTQIPAAPQLSPERRAYLEACAAKRKAGPIYFAASDALRSARARAERPARRGAELLFDVLDPLVTAEDTARRAYQAACVAFEATWEDVLDSEPQTGRYDR